MKVGDLVVVAPAREGVFLVVKKILKGDKDYPKYSVYEPNSALWLLFSEDIGCAPMNEEWIEVVNEHK